MYAILHQALQIVLFNDDGGGGGAVVMMTMIMMAKLILCRLLTFYSMYPHTKHVQSYMYFSLSLS